MSLLDVVYEPRYTEEVSNPSFPLEAILAVAAVAIIALLIIIIKRR